MSQEMSLTSSNSGSDCNIESLLHEGENDYHESTVVLTMETNYRKVIFKNNIYNVFKITPCNCNNVTHWNCFSPVNILLY